MRRVTFTTIVATVAFCQATIFAGSHGRATHASQVRPTTQTHGPAVQHASAPTTHGQATHAKPTHTTTTHGPSTHTTTTHGPSKTPSTHGSPKHTTAPKTTSGTGTTTTTGTSTTTGTTPTGTTTTGTTATTTTSSPIATKIQSHPQLASKVTAMLPAGMTMDQAASGFKNQGQFIAALHVSQNLGIPFADLKTEMVTNQRSLGQSIQQLRPGVESTTEAAHAETEAEHDVATTTATGTTTTSTKTKHAKKGR